MSAWTKPLIHHAAQLGTKMLCASMMSPDDSQHLGNPAQLYYWDRTTTNPRLIAEIELPNSDWKAESIMLDLGQSDNTDEVKLIIFFDKAKNGEPHRYAIPRSLF